MLCFLRSMPLRDTQAGLCRNLILIGESRRKGGSVAQAREQRTSDRAHVPATRRAVSSAAAEGQKRRTRKTNLDISIGSVVILLEAA